MTDARNKRAYSRLTYKELADQLSSHSSVVSDRKEDAIKKVFALSDLIEEFYAYEYRRISPAQKVDIDSKILAFDKRNLANHIAFQCNAIRFFRLLSACSVREQETLYQHSLNYLLPSAIKKYQDLLKRKPDEALTYYELIKVLASKSPPSNAIIEKFYRYTYWSLKQEQQESINARVLEYDLKNLKHGKRFKCNADRFYRLFNACPDQQDELYKNRSHYLLRFAKEPFQDLIQADLQSGKPATYHMLFDLFASHSGLSSAIIERFYLDVYHNLIPSQQENIDTMVLDYDTHNLNAYIPFRCNAVRFYRLFNACEDQQEHLFKTRFSYLDQSAAKEFEDLLVADLRKASGIILAESQAEKDAKQLKNKHQFSSDPVRNFHALRLLIEEEKVEDWHVFTFYKKFYPELSLDDKKLCNIYIAKKLRGRVPEYCQEYLSIANDQKTKRESSALSYFAKQSGSMPTGWKWLERTGIMLGIATIIAVILFPPLIVIAIPLIGKLAIAAGALLASFSAAIHLLDSRSTTVSFAGKLDNKQDLDNLAYDSTVGTQKSGILPLRETKAPKIGMDQKEIQERLHKSQLEREKQCNEQQALQEKEVLFKREERRTLVEQRVLLGLDQQYALDAKESPSARRPKAASAALASPADSKSKPHTPAFYKPKLPVPQLTTVPEFEDISDRVEHYQILNISKT